MRDFLILADATRPAPAFAELLHRLANPDPYARYRKYPHVMKAFERLNTFIASRKDTRDGE